MSYQDEPPTIAIKTFVTSIFIASSIFVDFWASASDGVRFSRMTYVMLYRQLRLMLKDATECTEHLINRHRDPLPVWQPGDQVLF